MLRIDHTAVRGADIGGKTIRPAAISAVCPKCNEKGVFSLGNFSPVGPQNSISADGICPSCKFKVGFWSVNPRGASNIEEAEIYMCPAPKLYSPIQGDLTGVPEPLRRSLLSTIECYNAGIYPATTVSGRRTLEGIFKYLVSEDKRKLNLAKLIDAAIADNDLSAPLSKLSHAIRSGGNLGAHFDMEHEPDENVARQIVDLLSYLISYLYILPAKINQLENALEKPSNNTIAEG